MKIGMHIAIALLLLLLCGCAGKNEINELAIVTAIGVDKKDEDKITVHFQIVNPGGSSSQQGGGSGTEKSATYTYSTSGHTLLEAYEHARNIIPRKLFFSHLFYIAVSEEFARERGLSLLYDVMERDPEMRSGTLVYVTKESKAKKLLLSYDPLEKNPGYAVRNRSRITSGSMGNIEGITLTDLIKWQFAKGREAVALGMTPLEPQADNSFIDQVSGKMNANPSSYQLTGFPLFCQDRLVAWFDLPQSQGWSILTNQMDKEFVYNINQCPGQPNQSDDQGSIGVLIKSISAKITPLESMGTPRFQVDAKGRINLKESTCPAKIEDPQVIHQIEQLVSAQLKEQVESAISKAQEVKSDVFGFGEILHKEKPSLWRRYEENWGEAFVEAKISINLNMELESTEERMQSVTEEEREKEEK
ncbi:Ger(x)C family spore germination protein [Mechercharimyces sp. CAU 1602]|uniref:Ger(x)C family spore germination protein n=1 Tax=Mechercharimyces sp. CAU 1602 TaxID=2973933 RepID=UPI0021617393|nr:Ger(x)C family spore germination protein [Mechercharimyces sp. CAU 1602]